MIEIAGPLGPAAHAYMDAMPNGDIVGFSLTPLDRTGIPVWVVALFPRDGRLDGIMPYGVGYGATDEAAILGALGETTEMIWPTLTLSKRSKTRASYTDLVRSLGASSVADPLTLCLPAGSPVNHGTVLDWIEACRVRDGATVLVPIELAAYSDKELTIGYQPFTKVISNGMGAGPDLDWAIGHGLCEILQRDGNGLVFRALDQGVLIDLPADMPPALQSAVDRCRTAGIHLMPKFATDEFGLTNVYCVGYDEQGQHPASPLMLTACGEACHPDRAKALEKAILEFAAARVRKACDHGPSSLVDRVSPHGYRARAVAQGGQSARATERRALTAMRDWSRRTPGELKAWLADTSYSVKSHKDYSTLPSTPAADARMRGAITRARVEAAGFDILYVDMSPPGQGVSVVRVIVPGMEVETMSYYRIGERNTQKLLAANSPLIRFGTPTSTLKPVRLTEQALERFGRKPLFDTALADATVGPLYPLYREPEAFQTVEQMSATA
jgi:ribosomal protein S12 methylthiotransferase accessory factor